MGFDGRIKVADRVEDFSFKDYLRMDKLLGKLGFLATAWGTKEFTLGQVRIVLVVTFGEKAIKVKVHQDGYALPVFRVFREAVHLQGNIAKPLHEFIEDRIIMRDLENGEVVQLTKADIEKLYSELEEIRRKRNADEVFNLNDFSKEDRKWFFQRFYTLHKGLKELLEEDLDSKYILYTADW